MVGDDRERRRSVFLVAMLVVERGAKSETTHRRIGSKPHIFLSAPRWKQPTRKIGSAWALLVAISVKFF
jgi:hypothetical protein